METTKSVAQQCLDILKPIPPSKFITGSLVNDKKQCCGRGHIIRVSCLKGKYNPLDISHMGFLDKCELDVKIVQASTNFLLSKIYRGSIAVVNNNSSIQYPQTTPKARVIALLKDMVEAGY